MEQEMDKGEMQRFLDEEFKRGTSREEALDRFLRILGLHYGESEIKDSERSSKN